MRDAKNTPSVTFGDTHLGRQGPPQGPFAEATAHIAPPLTVHCTVERETAALCPRGGQENCCANLGRQGTPQDPFALEITAGMS